MSAQPDAPGDPQDADPGHPDHPDLSVVEPPPFVQSVSTSEWLNGTKADAQAAQAELVAEPDRLDEIKSAYDRGEINWNVAHKLILTEQEGGIGSLQVRVERDAEREVREAKKNGQRIANMHAEKTEKARRRLEKKREKREAKRLLKAMLKRADPDRDEVEWMESEDAPLTPLLSWCADPLPEHLGPDADPEEEHLLAAGANLLVIANFKVGKTTAMLTLTYTLAGAPEPWMGAFTLAGQPRKVVYHDFELLEAQHKRWRRRASDALDVRSVADVQRRFRSLPLRSTSAPSPATKAGRAALVAAWLRYEPDVVILEPATAWMEGDGNSAEVVKEWTNGLDQAKGMYDDERRAAWEEAGAVGEPPLPLTVIVSLHTPKSVKPGEETAIGSGRWMGWADEYIVLGKNDDGRRSLSTGGRFIKVPETMLTGETRWTQVLDLARIGVGRKDIKESAGVEDQALILYRMVASGVEVNGWTGIIPAMGVKRKAAKEIFDHCVAQGWLAPRTSNQKGPLLLGTSRPAPTDAATEPTEEEEK